MNNQLRRRHVVVAVISMLLASLAIVPGAEAQTSNPYERGPDPTQASIEAPRGPFSTASTSVSSFVSGFGGGTIYYPTNTSQTFGGVAISPGFTASSSSVAWLGPRLASQGFVVIVIDTNSTYDQPASRGNQLLAALDHLASQSPVQDLVDDSRLAVMGHSMGGGGALEASADRPSLQASIPLTAWNTDKTWGEVQVPQLIIGAENDSIASVSSHSIPFYESLPASLEKAYLELNDASHFAPNTSNTTIAAYSISWLKRFVDDDTRYDQFLCGPNHEADPDISEYRSTCPYSEGGDDDDDPPVACVTDSTVDHVSADRAVRAWWGTVYAAGTYDNLGIYSSFNTVSLQQVDGGWQEVASCPSA